MDSSHTLPTNVTIILDDTTSPGLLPVVTDSSLIQLLQYVSQHIPELQSETMLDFRSKNLTRSVVRRPTKICATCVLASTSDQVYPWLQVSRVGVSADGQQALAYTGVVSAPLAGAGYYFVLSSQNGVWTITGSVMVWIS